MSAVSFSFVAVALEMRASFHSSKNGRRTKCQISFEQFDSDPTIYHRPVLLDYEHGMCDYC